jgi:hypothetical protein
VIFHEGPILDALTLDGLVATEDATEDVKKRIDESIAQFGLVSDITDGCRFAAPAYDNTAQSWHVDISSSEYTHRLVVYLRPANGDNMTQFVRLDGENDATSKQTDRRAPGLLPPVNEYVDQNTGAAQWYLPGCTMAGCAVIFDALVYHRGPEESTVPRMLVWLKPKT